MVVSLRAFDPHPYRILLAEEINSMFMKREHSYFVADFIWRQDNVAGICQQCTIDFTRSLLTNKTDSKLTAISAWCCC